MKKVIFDLPSFSLVYTLVSEKLKCCKSCEDKGCKHCFYDVLLRVFGSLDSACYEKEKEDKNELP